MSRPFQKLGWLVQDGAQKPVVGILGGWDPMTCNVDNNHGVRCCPLRIGLFPLPNWANKWLINGGY